MSRIDLQSRDCAILALAIAKGSFYLLLLYLPPHEFCKSRTRLWRYIKRSQWGSIPISMRISN